MEAGTGFRMGVRTKIVSRIFRRLERFHDFSVVAEVLGCGSDALRGGTGTPCEGDEWTCAGASGYSDCEDAGGVRCGHGTCVVGLKRPTWRAWAAAWAVVLCLPAVAALAQTSSPAGLSRQRQQPVNLPPRMLQAERFLAERGWGAAPWTQRRQNLRTTNLAPGLMRAQAARAAVKLSAAIAQSPATATWQPLGPAAVITPSFGLVTGRVTSLALDPSDVTGNRLYVGTTGGGVWEAQNAAATDVSSITLTPLTDTVNALGGAPGASISIGALTVQPGGTGVILAGTGDPNDALDSYYGAGILRSTDGGATWALIQQTMDREDVLGSQDYSFIGEGFAGFAWSTANPELVVAAVSQAYEGTLVAASQPGFSYEGLYYSNDAGATWHLATITDGNGSDVQGPLDAFTLPDGNAATAVVWNPMRKLFIAAVRYHGYYQSADGVTWTRMSAQPGTGLTTAYCPTYPTMVGSIACPIFRGALAVNPQTGDTFAWTVDIDNQDQGLWQDQCAISGGGCGNPAITFGKQWNTTALEADTPSGATTIPNGDYNLVLAAVPSQQDTLLLAGANDLWKCSLAMGCVWRNTTNTTTCMSAQVGEFQHALEWSAANPLEVLVGNDSGLWRSTDAIGETGSVCSATDSSHFQNLNGGLGSLAEAGSIAQDVQSPYTMLAGLGVNGSAGVKSTSGPTADWPQLLSGDGGPVEIDPANPSNWYVNNGAGVSIHLCSQSSDCTAADFGTNAAVNNGDVGGDGYTMATPAPFMVDPADSSQLLIGTCRIWRGPANGSNWTSSNAISPILDDGASGSACDGDAQIRSLASMAVPGGEVIYVGMYGALDGGATIPGQVFRAMLSSTASTMPVWQDLTLNPVTNSNATLNYYGFDVSSIYIDPHDPSGNTVYITVEGTNTAQISVHTIYRSTDGGASWMEITSNIPTAPANSIVVDPKDANTVYVSTDTGVYFTTQVGTCAQNGSACWSAFGTGLPEAPVVALSAAPLSSSQQVLVASTYGRGIWQTPLWTAETSLTTATTSAAALTFAAQNMGSTSSAQTLTVYNTGSIALTAAGIVTSGDFSETDNCQTAPIAAGGSCAIEVAFTPTEAGARTGQLTLSANVYAGQITVDLSGTGIANGAVTPSPANVNFGNVTTGTTSAPLPVDVANASADAVPIHSISVSAPFVLASNSCGTTSLAAQSDCQIQVEFAPTQTGAATGTLTLNDGLGIQSVVLEGNGATPAADSLSPGSLAFPQTIAGQVSAAQAVQLTNSGDAPLTSISAGVSAGFEISSNNCTTQLAGHASCAIAVAFDPTQAGAQNGTLTVSDALRTQTVVLSGTGLAPPAISVSPSSLTFAGQQPGVASAPQTVTVVNSGGAAMANVGFQISGGGASSFAVSGTTCGATLGSGSSCTAQVTFNPMAAGEIITTLTVSSSTLGVNPASVVLNGTGELSTGLSVSPTQLSFPAANPGQSTATLAVTVTNTTSYSIDSVSMAVSGPFVVTQNSCTGSLAAGAQCTAALAFAPTSSAAAIGMLTVSSPGIATPSSVALLGSGGIQVTPAAIKFPSTGAGMTSSPSTVTVTNLSATEALTNVALNVPSGFQLVSNTCGATLDALTSCTAGVEFAPTAPGTQSGNLTVTTSTLQATPVALSGMGFDFGAAISGSSSQTVASGQTADYTMAISALNGSGGTFAFQCMSLPAHASCAFNPLTETLSAGAQGNVTVAISTGQATAAAEAPAAPWRAVPLICCVFLLPLAGKRRRVLLIAVLLAAVMCFGASACTSSGGGGSSGAQGGGSSATPAGTYSIQVIASSTGVQHTMTVTLTVD